MSKSPFPGAEAVISPEPKHPEALHIPPWLPGTILRGHLQHFLLLDLSFVTTEGIKLREVYKDALNQRVYPCLQLHNHGGADVDAAFLSANSRSVVSAL